MYHFICIIKLILDKKKREKEKEYYNPSNSHNTFDTENGDFSSNFQSILLSLNTCQSDLRETGNHRALEANWNGLSEQI